MGLGVALSMTYRDRHLTLGLGLRSRKQGTGGLFLPHIGDVIPEAIGAFGIGLGFVQFLLGWVAINTFDLFQEKRLRFILHWTSSEVVLLKICFLIVQELDFPSFLLESSSKTDKRHSVEMLGYLLSSFSVKCGSVDVYTLKNKHSLLALMVP